MKSVGLVQIFCPVKQTNRTHSIDYVEDSRAQTGRKRCAKTARLNLSMLLLICIHEKVGKNPLLVYLFSYCVTWVTKFSKII